MSKKTQKKPLEQPVVSGSVPKIQVFAIIAKFDDGKCRQILIKDTTKNIILQTIAAYEQQVRVLETPIYGIDLEVTK